MKISSISLIAAALAANAIPVRQTIVLPDPKLHDRANLHQIENYRQNYHPDQEAALFAYSHYHAYRATHPDQQDPHLQTSHASHPQAPHKQDQAPNRSPQTPHLHPPPQEAPRGIQEHQLHTFCQQHSPAPPHPQAALPQAQLLQHRLQHHNALLKIGPAIEATKKATMVAAEKGQDEIKKHLESAHNQLEGWHKQHTLGYDAKEPTMDKDDIKGHATTAWYYQQQANNVINGQPLYHGLPQAKLPK